MVLRETRKYLFLAAGVLPLCALTVLATHAWGAGQPKASGSNEQLRVLMTQRYEMLQQMVKNAQIEVDAGRGDAAVFHHLTVRMYQAEADLCTTTAARAKVYEKLVDEATAAEQFIERRAAAGRATVTEVAESKLATLDARIDLERVRLGQAPSQSL